MDWDLWCTGYRKQIEAVKDLSESLEVGYVDTQKLMERNADKPIFMDFVHFTRQASEIMAEAISIKIMRIYPSLIFATASSG